DLHLAAGGEEAFAPVGGVQRLGGLVPAGVVQVEGAHAGVVGGGARPAQRLGPLAHPRAGHAAHAGGVGDEVVPQVLVVHPPLGERLTPFGAGPAGVQLRQGVCQADPDLPVRPGLADPVDDLVLPADGPVVAAHVDAFH